MKKHYLCILVSIFFLSISSIGLDAQGASDQAADDASILIVHGIPGLDIGEEATYPIDVYIDGTKRLSNVKYGKIKRIKTPSGTAAIALYRAGMGPEEGYPAVLEGDFNFKKQETASIVAYLHADGKTRLVKFTNDLSPAGHPSKCRVIIHNTSAEAKVALWLFNKNRKQDHCPWLENDVLEPGDKNAFEIAKKSLANNENWAWKLEIDKGWYWEDWQDMYDKPLNIKPGKGILIYIVGTVSSKTYKVIKRTVALK